MKENMGQLLNRIERSKFKSIPTRKVKKMIKKTLVLNELEKEKAKGLRNTISSVFAFLNSGNPKLPILNSDDDLDEKLGNSMFVQKLIELPISIVFLPFFAIKMGVNTIKLANWLKEKPELVSTLKGQHLYDNIVDFSTEQKQNFNINSTSEYFDHVLDKHSPFPSEYDNLIEGMSDEFKELQQEQKEYDKEYDRRHL